MTQKITISQSALAAAWDVVMDTLNAPDTDTYEVLFSIRCDDVEAAWIAFDKKMARQGLTQREELRDPEARRLFFPYDLMALILRAEREVEMLEEFPVAGLPN